MLSEIRRHVLPLLAAAVLPDCGRQAASSGNSEPRTAAAMKGSVEDVFILTGELRAPTSTEVVAPRVEEGQPQIQWLAEDGTLVKQGDPVVQFDNTAVVATIEERRTRLLQAEIQRESRERELAAERERRLATVSKAEVEVEKARVDAAVPQELRSMLDHRKFQAALREKDAALERARLDLQAFDVSVRSELASLRAAEEKARRLLESGERALTAITVRAPRAGIFIVGQHWRGDEDRKLQAGDQVWTGLTVGSIPDLTRMEVDARLPEPDHGRIAPGMEARVILDTWPDRVFEGRVEDVATVAAEAVRNRPGFPVRISLARTDADVMRPGLSARVEVVRGRWSEALVVPRAAVRFQEGNPPGRNRRGHPPLVRDREAMTGRRW
jgi:HlyD family secretion protein